ncbi:MAG: hypothetical protein K9K75_01600 [Deltaproteobacteria bacterium]|nr:hypothetical protein [Deltaproteobacteria bacterium]
MPAKIIKTFQAYLDYRFRGNDGQKQGSAVVQESSVELQTANSFPKKTITLAKIKRGEPSYGFPALL